MSAFEPSGGRVPPITPQLALRVAVLGVLALALFGIVFFRLWYLQVLSGDQYLRQAQDNRVRELSVQAPRGAVLDRNGQPLVENRVATVVKLDPERLPAAERDAAARWGQQMTARSRRPKGEKGPPPPIPGPATPELQVRFKRLGRALNMSPRTIQERVVRSLVLVPYASVTIKTDVPATVRNYLLERSSQFRGVNVQKVYLRKYPNRRLAAQLAGTVGEISPDELKLERFRGVKQGTVVGKEGVERAYDRYLRGLDGAQRITVDALGRPKGQAQSRDPVPGRSLKTSLDLDLQRTGEAVLERTIAAGPGTAGAFVALDPRNGQVLAMGSAPSYDPAVLSRPITQRRLNQLFGEAAGSPRYNRATGGLYPTGSTFKPITALAALDKGIITPSTPISDPGCIKIGAAEQEFCNAGKVVNGTVALPRALQVSSDVFFYTLGRDLNPLDGQPLQRWAHRLGLGEQTGIDLPSEVPGLVPDRAWRAEVAEDERRCRKRRNIPLSAFSGCGISDMRPWTVGDNVNLSVGQGDLQATPLQMAVAYAAIANGGRVVRPHLGVAVEDANGRELQKIDPGTARRVHLDPAGRQAIMAGLHAATMGDGTSADVFRGWNQEAFPVFGKTGTAERPGHGDQSWYVCFVPNASKPIALAVTVEDGGFGAEAAAPVARVMLAQWFNQKKTFIAGKSRTN
ncbi:MAG TPA: penicillin-binding transpeptidase domain-containing protein [Solirubrobacteraceae bacterium]|nr:penicillin-binding transpeptidase domain-containing protein [Solirubrobacteraceae bacterium]